MTHPTGLTRTAGFQIGVSKTLPLPPEAVWRFITGPEGLALWLGRGARIRPERGSAYRTDEGVTGEVRGYQEGTRLRLTHRPAAAERETTVQITVTAQGAGCVLRFHQERLSGTRERAEQRDHWRAVMAEVAGVLLPERRE
ncbi:SRPBCC family protein [Streptomyces cucumeris]|uniref:SRPBCC family protein n=1 Tax=Streptomyces cucumeris TaxID=2962890 RepID=UPI003D73CF7B